MKQETCKSIAQKSKVLWPSDLVRDIPRHNLAASLFREQKIRVYKG